MADASVASTRPNSVNSQKLLITLFILSVLGYGLLNHEFGEIVLASIADAYIQVTSFVALHYFYFTRLSGYSKLISPRNYLSLEILRNFLLPYLAHCLGVAALSSWLPVMFQARLVLALSLRH